MAMPPLPALKSLEDFLHGSFDYIVVGGGTAGLAVAAHLTEDPNITVGVLEAGAAKLGDQNIMCPAAFGQLVGNPEYDWLIQTVPQVLMPRIYIKYDKVRTLNVSCYRKTEKPTLTPVANA